MGDKCHSNWYRHVVKRITIRDFRTRPKQLREELCQEDEALLTANGQPIALVIPVDEDSLDETLETVRRSRGLEALRALRRASKKAGTSALSVAEIDGLVQKTRRARKRPGRA